MVVYTCEQYLYMDTYMYGSSYIYVCMDYIYILKTPTAGHRRTPRQAAPHNPPLMFFSLVEIEAIAGRVQGRNHFTIFSVRISLSMHFMFC